MATVAYRITLLLEKMASTDKDYRYMALNDMINDLQNNVLKLDNTVEDRVIHSVKRLVTDGNCEVQNMAVKCLGTLITRISDSLAFSTLDELCKFILENKDGMAGTATTSLKYMIAEYEQISSPHIPKVFAHIIPGLVAALDSKQHEVELCTKIEVMDMLKDIMNRYGATLTDFHRPVHNVSLELLACDRQALRKKAIFTLGSLMCIVNSDLYNSTLTAILGQLSDTNASLGTLRTYTQASQSICRLSGDKFAAFLPSFVSCLLGFIETKITEDEELIEACLQTFCVYISSCPKDILPYADSIMHAVVKCLKYDPNCRDVNGLSVEKMESSDDEDEKSDFSDDDDYSWKVRRAAASCVEVLIWSHRQETPIFLKVLGPLLLERFQEREFNVKWEIMRAYLALLVQAKSFFPNFGWIMADGSASENDVIIFGDVRYLRSAISPVQAEILKIVDKQIPCLVKKVNQELNIKVQKTMQPCFSILTNLVRTYPGALNNYFDLLLPCIRTALNDKSNSNMKVAVIEFLNAIIHSHRAEKLQEHFAQFIPMTVSAINDPFYKVVVEALILTNTISRALTQASSMVAANLMSAFINSIFDAVFEKFRKTDVDHEVKEKSISTMALLIANFNPFFIEKATLCVPVFLDRLRNESTRLVAVKALHIIVNSEHKLDLSNVCDKLLSILSEFLRQSNRTLRISALNLLDSLIHNYSEIQPDLREVVKGTPALLSDLDLHISQTTLDFLSDVAKCYPHFLRDCLPELLASFSTLIQSILLRGASLESAKKFLNALIRSNIDGMFTFSEIVDYLSAPVYDGTQFQFNGYYNIASCIATVAEATHDLSRCVSLAQCLQKHLKSNTTVSIELFSILTLGELGRCCPETFVTAELIKPECLIIDAFNSSSEELKTAASYALGGLAVGNLEKFLPFILNEISCESKHQYLLLNSLKEVISSESVNSRAIEFFRPLINQIWPVLLDHAVSNEEGTRNVVSECFGKLCLLEPEILLPKLEECLNSEYHLLRACVVASVKYILVKNRNDIDGMLQACLPHFLDLVKDDDRRVKRVALNTLNCAAHNKPKLIRDILHNFLPSLYEETIQKKELVREVEMGPFKHTVDDGIDTRKAAFECMYTLLDNCLEKLDVFEFMSYMENGLNDFHEIKVLAYLMISRLGLLCPSQVLQRLDKICEPLNSQLRTKAKMNSVKQEIEKIEELHRAALRAVIIIDQITDSERNQQFCDLLNYVRDDPELYALFSSVEKDVTRMSSDAIFGAE